MGNQEISLKSQMPTETIIKMIQSSLRLVQQKNQHTKSLINKYFSRAISSKSKGDFSRLLNPFCVVQITDKVNKQIVMWTQCCIISPIMAIASPRSIYNAQQKTKKRAVLKGVSKEGAIQRFIKDIIIILPNILALLVFEIPLWQLGWAGIKYIKSENEIQAISLKTLQHPHRSINQEKQYIYTQILSKIFPKKQQNFKAEHKDKQQVLIFTIEDQKPYVVGIQASQQSIQFIDSKIFVEMQNIIKIYYKDKQNQKQLIKNIDLEKFQMEAQW